MSDLADFWEAVKSFTHQGVPQCTRIVHISPFIILVVNKDGWKSPTFGETSVRTNWTLKKDNDDHHECWLKRCEEMTRDTTSLFTFCCRSVCTTSLRTAWIWVGFKSQTFQVSNLEWHLSQGWIHNFHVGVKCRGEKAAKAAFPLSASAWDQFFAAAASSACWCCCHAAAVPCFTPPPTPSLVVSRLISASRVEPDPQHQPSSLYRLNKP